MILLTGEHMKLLLILFAVIIAAVSPCGDAVADIFIRIHADGHKEFTNRPSGPGWVFHMTESGEEPKIEFAQAGKPKDIEEIVKEISYKFDIDPSLVKAIIVAESNSNPAAVSKERRSRTNATYARNGKVIKRIQAFGSQRESSRGRKIYKGVARLLR